MILFIAILKNYCKTLTFIKNDTNSIKISCVGIKTNKQTIRRPFFFFFLPVTANKQFLGPIQVQRYKLIKVKGALDKSNIYLFISSSIKDCKSN